MNIFVLDNDPKIAAQYHCDKHMKMITESTQMMFTNCVIAGVDVSTCPPNAKGEPRRVNHINHPCTKWARTSQQNFDWLWHLATELCQVNLTRYKKFRYDIHAIDWLWHHSRGVFPNIGRTPFAQAMPIEYKHNDPVIAYRQFYRKDKSRFAKWRFSQVPEFMVGV